ncbi:50S ribosomal protein L25/general stress protein Ctc [Salicibibacter cibarius]|uniref:Large ribosomal subunit protein bL25 n=1 Tax=Salicibibacter cibarius TaxID=2743000 RepID=A0A7T6YZY3_9BACI|nr:50S ribosomal protein L25/general stress protein Ctc [Salicibibacter cibarius]QQK74273.1 50S ribosomal protein L25/general stress protein Ctc [Salicibibacter cibarius]
MATLEANKREDLRRSETRKLRAEGYVPAVLYGKKTDSTPVYVPSIAFTKTLRQVGWNGIIDLTVDNGSKHQVMVHDLQKDVIKGHNTHIDFFEVDMTSEMDADVAVNLVGDAPGESEGGVLSHMLYTVSVRALPRDIPEQIDVDISELGINDSILVGDLKAGQNFEFSSEAEETIVSVLPPTEEEPESEGDEEQEPELVDSKEDENEE